MYITVTRKIQLARQFVFLNQTNFFETQGHDVIDTRNSKAIFNC